MRILQTWRATADCAQHAGSTCFIKAKVQPIAWRVHIAHRSYHVSLIAKKRKATCHDSTHASTADSGNRDDASTDKYSTLSDVLRTPESAVSSRLGCQHPTELPIGQGNGGSSGYGGGGGNGAGDGGEDDNDDKGDSKPRGPLLIRIIGLFFRGPVLAILLSVVIYNWLQARHQRKQRAYAAANDAREQSASEATLFMGADWPPLHAGDQQEATAPHGSAAGHTADRASKTGPFGRLAALLPWTKKSKLREDIQRLKRLQRDAFEQMLRLDIRLNELEDKSAESLGDTNSGVSALFSSPQGRNRAYAGAELAPIQASGRLVYGASVPLHGGHQNSSGQQQHLGAGPELRLRLESLDADSGRSVKALVTADPNQSGPRLQKLLYGGPAGENLRFLVALLNGRGDDLAPTLHPQSGRGVTCLMRHGCPLHQTCQGSGVGAKYRAGEYYLTAAHLRGTALHQGMQGSTLLQVDCAPTAQLALGITGVQRGLAAAAYRAHAATSAAGRDPADEDAGASPASSGGAAAGAGSALLQGSSGGLNRSLALTGAWRSYFDEYAISGWLALKQATGRQQQSWGATISSVPDMDGQGWALSLGRLPCSASDQEQQILAEAALHIRPGRGMLLTPSVIGSHSQQGATALAALRAELSF